MSLIAPLIKELLIDGVLMARLRNHAEAKMAGLGFYALAGLFAASGAVFLIYAGFLALEDIYSPLVSALWAGGVLLALAVVVGIATGVYLKRKQRHRIASNEQMVAMFHTLFESIEAEISEPIKENPKTALLLAGMAGLFARNFIR